MFNVTAIKICWPYTLSRFAQLFDLFSDEGNPCLIGVSKGLHLWVILEAGTFDSSRTKTSTSSADFALKNAMF